MEVRQHRISDRNAEKFLERFPEVYLVRINDVDATGPEERFTGIRGKAAHILGAIKTATACRPFSSPGDNRLF